MGAPTVLGVRFAIAALVLAVVAVAAGKRPVPVPGERRAAFLLGAVGYMVESTFFFSGLERGTAAAVSLVFYTYPAIVTLAEAALARRWPDRVTVAALAMAGVGGAIVVVATGHVDITPAGVAFSLGSSASFAAYVMVGHRVVHRTDSRITGAWVAGGAALSFLIRGLVGGSLVWPAGRWLALTANGFATAAAFGLMFAALKRIGPGPTAVVMTLEAVFAVILAALFLGESITPIQTVGGLTVLAAAAVMSRRRAVAEATTEVPTAP